MVQVLLISNKNKEAVKKIEEVIGNFSSDYFIDVDLKVLTEEQAIMADCDFVVSLIPMISVDDKKVIDATAILVDTCNEKTEKDILNQLLRCKVRNLKNKK